MTFDCIKLSVAHTEKLTHACQNGFLKIALPLEVWFWLLPQKRHWRTVWDRYPPCTKPWIWTIHLIWNKLSKTYACKCSKLNQEVCIFWFDISEGCASAGVRSFSLMCKKKKKKSVSGWGIAVRVCVCVCSCRHWCRCRRREKWGKDTTRKWSGGCTVQSSIK